MAQKLISQLDDDGYFVGSTLTEQSPLEPGSNYIPPLAIDVAPPTIPAGKRAKWDNGSWIFENIPEPEQQLGPESPAVEYTVDQKRRMEYPALADLADAIYWQSKGDESKMTAYLAAVEAVKQKYPKGV